MKYATDTVMFPTWQIESLESIVQKTLTEAAKPPGEKDLIVLAAHGTVLAEFVDRYIKTAKPTTTDRFYSGEDKAAVTDKTG